MEKKLRSLPAPSTSRGLVELPRDGAQPVDVDEGVVADEDPPAVEDDRRQREARALRPLRPVGRDHRGGRGAETGRPKSSEKIPFGSCSHCRGAAPNSFRTWLAKESGRRENSSSKTAAVATVGAM